MKHQSAVHRDADILEGTPVFVGTRVPFKTLIDCLEEGQTLAKFIADFPTGGTRSSARWKRLRKPFWRMRVLTGWGNY